MSGVRAAREASIQKSLGAGSDLFVLSKAFKYKYA